tara:strand:- start:1037 stop:1735 length:699 start_codon:yes stop_codon:yes gene_type:complete
MITNILETKKLDFRYEKKFFIEHLSKEEITSLIKHHPAFFKEIYKERQINNIYLDTPALTSFLDNVEGNNRRIKARIRWYGNFFGKITKPVLELKVKSGALGTKLHYKLKPFTLTKGFSFTTLEANFKQSNLPEWLGEKLKHLQPILFNTYKRKYYLSADKQYRLTVDRNIIYYSATPLNNKFLITQAIKPPIIVELKYDQNHDLEAHHITQAFPFRLDKHSKYATGVYQLH